SHGGECTAKREGERQESKSSDRHEFPRVVTSPARLFVRALAKSCYITARRWSQESRSALSSPKPDVGHLPRRGAGGRRSRRRTSRWPTSRRRRRGVRVIGELFALVRRVSHVRDTDGVGARVLTVEDDGIGRRVAALDLHRARVVLEAL